LAGPAALVVIAVPVAAVLVSRLPRHPVTVLLAVFVGSQLTGMGLGNLLHVLAESGRISEEVAVRTTNAIWVGSLPVLPLLLTVFPDGVPAGRWRRVFDAQVAAVAGLLGTTFLDSPEDGFHPITAAFIAACAAVLISTGVIAAVRQAVQWHGIGRYARRWPISPLWRFDLVPVRGRRASHVRLSRPQECWRGRVHPCHCGGTGGG
jgi:hypothetical protein